MATSCPGLEVIESNESVTARFVDRTILNDQKMEVTGTELFRLSDTLAGRELRLDFGKVEYIQSSVLGKLVHLHKKVTGDGNRLVLCCLNPGVYKVFAVTRLERIFAFDADYSDEGSNISKQKK